MPELKTTKNIILKIDRKKTYYSIKKRIKENIPSRSAKLRYVIKKS